MARGDAGRTALTALAIVCALFAASSAAEAVEPAHLLDVDADVHVASLAEPDGDLLPPASADELAAWITASGDAEGRPFAIIDKRRAEVLVFDGEGQPQGAAPVLLGSQPGDDSVPGIGDRKLSAIRPNERTTPAGRFVATFGVGPERQEVLWVDYGTAISLHPVVTANRKERRLQRLESASPNDNRITYGCINVWSDFYKKVVRPTFWPEGGVVYILPDTRPLAEVFPSFAVHLAIGPTPPSEATAADAREFSDLGPPPP